MNARSRTRQAVHLLDRAAELVHAGWCRDGLARDARDRLVEPWSSAARSWSPLGALLKAWFDTDDDDGRAFWIASAALAVATGGRIEEWNAARWRTSRHAANALRRAKTLVPTVSLPREVGTGRSSGEPGSRKGAAA